MPDTIKTLSDLGLTPHGRLRIKDGGSPSTWLDLEAGRRVLATFADSPAHGLLHLGTRELNTPLPPVAAW
jgi:hypothetical protein